MTEIILALVGRRFLRTYNAHSILKNQAVHDSPAIEILLDEISTSAR